MLNFGLDGDHQTFAGVSGIASTASSLDGWLLSPFGMLRPNAVICDGQGANSTALRLEKKYQIPDPTRRTLLKFASVHASVQNYFPTERHLQNRDHNKPIRAAALAEWLGLLAA